MGLNYSEFPNNSMRKVGEAGMPNREIVIDHLNDCIEASRRNNTWVFVRKDIVDDAIALLKEREAKYPVCEKCGKEIDHINTSVFNYDGSDSDYSVPITYSKENGCVLFSTSQKWTGYDLTDGEQKERIRCPYCGKYPFDDSIEIEFYEPVEVMMWTSESR